ncbi:hypothetical protein EGC79_20485, partial [Shewanella vesiculosa]
SNGTRLRIEASKAISAVQINAGIAANGGKSRSAKQLQDFFTFCANTMTTFLDVVVPTIVARSIAPSAASELVITASEGLNKANVPDVGDFVIAGQVRTITKCVIDGPFVRLTVSAPFITGAVTVAYTQSATVSKRLQDASGNQVASFTATAVTNGIV